MLIINQVKYGRLSVLENLPGHLVHVRCECGREKNVSKYGLLKGTTLSCGCYKGSLLATFNRTHAMSATRQYRIWNGIRNRCLNPNRSVFKYYGGRGIKLDPRWTKFELFWEDMAAGYSDSLEIDRIDNNGDYTKDNCRWATRREQIRNQPRTRHIEIDGRDYTLREWCEEKGVSFNTIETRIRKRHMSLREAIEKPILKRQGRPC